MLVFSFLFCLANSSAPLRRNKKGARKKILRLRSVHPFFRLVPWCGPESIRDTTV